MTGQTDVSYTDANGNRTMAGYVTGLGISDGDILLFNGQLTAADHPTGQTDESYSYDANGNRTMTGYQTGTDNRLLSDGTYNYEYDAEGNRARRVNIATGARTEYQFDHRNRLISVKDFAQIVQPDEGQGTNWGWGESSVTGFVTMELEGPGSGSSGGTSDYATCHFQIATGNVTEGDDIVLNFGASADDETDSCGGDWSGFGSGGQVSVDIGGEGVSVNLPTEGDAFWQPTIEVEFTMQAGGGNVVVVYAYILNDDTASPFTAGDAFSASIGTK